MFPFTARPSPLHENGPEKNNDLLSGATGRGAKGIAPFFTKRVRPAFLERSKPRDTSDKGLLRCNKVSRACGIYSGCANLVTSKASIRPGLKIVACSIRICGVGAAIDLIIPTTPVTVNGVRRGA